MVDATPIPEHYKDQAEAVRAHLVHLRGGAPFLSPADALCLVRWLDASVTVRVILAALDRAMESRRRSRCKKPLTLVAARAHLHKPPLVPVDLVPGVSHPLEPVQQALMDLQDPESAVLAGRLLALPADGPDAVVPAALALCREHVEARWLALPHADREQRIADAASELGDLANLVDADALRALAEEVARDTFRMAPGPSPWPRMDAAAFAHLCAQEGR